MKNLQDCESLHQWTGPTSRNYHVCAGVVGGGTGQCSVCGCYYYKFHLGLHTSFRVILVDRL